MKKLCLLILMTTVLCLTACGVESDNETSEITDRATEIETFELTDIGTDFLAQMCKELNDFDAQTTMDDKFWRDFHFIPIQALYQKMQK